MGFLSFLENLALANEQYLYAFIAVMSRMSVFVFLLPGLGERGIPVRVRIMLVLVLCFLITPLIAEHVSNPAFNMLAGMIALEAFYGFVLGFSLRLMLFVLQITGTIISQNMSLTQVFGGGMTSEPNTSISTILMLSGVALMLSFDLHIRAVSLFVKSYQTFPLSGFNQFHLPDFEAIAYTISKKTMQVFSFATALALPFLVLNFIYNLMLGFVNKAMPQLMVSFVGMPFITGIGIVLLALSAGGILLVWVKNFNDLLNL